MQLKRPELEGWVGVAVVAMTYAMLAFLIARGVDRATTIALMGAQSILSLYATRKKGPPPGTGTLLVMVIVATVTVTSLGACR